MNKESRIIVTAGKEIKKWIEFINLNRFAVNSKVRKVVFDFSKHEFIYPHQLVSIACLIEEYHQNGVRIEFIREGDTGLIEYLHKIRLFDYWEQGFDRTEYTINPSRESLFLWKTSKEKLDPFASYIQNFYEDNYFEGSDCTNLNNALQETINNIYDHSSCNGISYAFAQYYPKNQHFRVSVCDFGVGVPTRVNEFLQKSGKPLLDNAEAIKMAFKFKFTSESTPRNRGFGLDNLKNCVRDGNGKLRYYSLNGSYHINENNRTASRLSENYFPGTLIDLKIDARNLPQKDFFGQDFNF